MTLALSIRPDAGVILCCESQITENGAKYDEPKITFTVLTTEIKLAITGAGWWDYVQMASEELPRAILDSDDGADVSDTIKSVITGLYDNQIRAYPNEYDKAESISVDRSH